MSEKPPAWHDTAMVFVMIALGASMIALVTAFIIFGALGMIDS